MPSIWDSQIQELSLFHSYSLPMKHSTSQDFIGADSVYLLENLEELVVFLGMSAGRLIKPKLLVLAATLYFSWL